MKTYDVLIIGAGPAGLTAALYSARNDLKVAVVGKEIGGTTNTILKLENWPGFNGKGPDLMKKFYGQVKEYPVDFILEEVTDLNKKGKEFSVKTNKQEIISKTIIIATGTERKKLNLKNEKEFVGKGVSYCVTCDSFFFKNKTVGVIGGSDCAATSAVALSNIAKKVYLFYRKDKLKCEKVTEKKINSKKNIEVIYGSIPKELVGKEKVEGINVEISEKNKSFEIDGLFIEIGSLPLTKLSQNLGLKLNEKNYVVVDEDMKTSVKGIFAAGDVTSQKLKQVVVAAGQGAIAAKSAYDYLY
jgi:thioredoxin reductase (NADPH)